jgi:serine/threonine protein kinase
MRDLFSALSHLHSLKIIHRDVKPENVLLTTGLHCKLTDFGLSKQKLASSLGSSTKAAGSLDYMAVEVRNRKKATHRSDVYSAALTCYSILSRLGVPAPHLLSEKIEECVEDHDEQMRVFFEGCLQSDPIDRLSSSEALQLIIQIQETVPLPDPRRPEVA